MSTKQLSGHDVFWLARHAHNVLDPLIKVAQTYEPSIIFKIEMRFDCIGGNNKPLSNAVEVMAHWDRGGMFFMSELLRDKSGLDRWAKFIRDFCDKEQAALEAREDAAAEARDWDLKQERIRERADIEEDAA